jgi:hypothetical protein
MLIPSVVMLSDVMLNVVELVLELEHSEDDQPFGYFALHSLRLVYTMAKIVLSLWVLRTEKN